MNYEDVKAKLLWNWTHDEPVASEVYTDDALLEFPQSGEKFRGDLVDRETIYQGDPFPPSEARAPYAERTELDATPGLPVRIKAAGSE
jgi:hypothetical protein